MPDSHNAPRGLPETVLEATLNELGGEALEGSGFEQEESIALDNEPMEGDGQ
jgi:hypothetical protein